jgi:hypothetical protein
MIITNHELTIGDYTILVDIVLNEVDGSFDHEFGTEKLTDYEVVSVEPTEIEYKELFSLEYLKQYVEENLTDLEFKD